MEDRSELLQTFNSTREGFRAWCYFMDSRAATQEQKSHFIDTELWEIAKDVPCHAELIRYTWWHNYALELTRLKSLPVHFLFYEDYTDNWETTVKQLFQFLDLSPALGAEPLEFISGKHYADYFDPEDIVMAKLLVETLASPEAWALLKNYFP